MLIDGLGYVYVCECYVALTVFPVCVYGCVVGYFWCFRFMCEFCFLYCDDVWLGAVYDFFLVPRFCF